MSDINAPLAIKMYEHGLRKLTDPNWTGLDLYYLLKRPVRGGDVLRKTLKEGLLYHLGLWFFDEYVMNSGERASGPPLRLRGEYRLWYLDDLVSTLVHHGVPSDDELISNVAAYVQKVYGLYEDNEGKYFDLVESKWGRRQLLGRAKLLRKEYSGVLDEIRPKYAVDYAQRVFHDRQLCEFICKVLVIIGYPGDHDDTDLPWQWVERKAFPNWAKRAVSARDRGRCAECGANLSGELEAVPHIDHIVPLAKGGNNDLANLQLLCAACNLSKNADEKPVKSSVPRYLQILA